MTTHQAERVIELLASIDTGLVFLVCFVGGILVLKSFEFWRKK